MIRVFFRLHQIKLRLKQCVEIQAILKKQNDNILIKTRPQLINQLANFNQMVEFFITAQKPTFEIMIVMLVKDVKKYIGMYDINIEEWQQNTNNDIIGKIKKCPDSGATISFSFMFMRCLDVEAIGLKTGKKLIQLREVAVKKCQEEMRQIQNTNKQLIFQNKKLCQQLLRVKQQNQAIKLKEKHLKQEHLTKYNNLEQKIKEKQRDVLSSHKDIKYIYEQLEMINQFMSSSYNRSSNNSQTNKRVNFNHQNDIKIGQIMNLITQALQTSRQIKNKNQLLIQDFNKDRHKYKLRNGRQIEEGQRKLQRRMNINKNNLQLLCNANEQDIQYQEKIEQEIQRQYSQMEEQ